MKPDIAFKLLKLDISDMVDAEVAWAHYETGQNRKNPCDWSNLEVEGVTQVSIENPARG